VFAIVVTLLVLEIKVPHVANHGSVSDLLRALLDLAPKFAGSSGGTPTSSSGPPSSRFRRP